MTEEARLIEKLQRIEALFAASATREDLTRVIQTALENRRPLVPASDLLRRRPRRP